MKLKELGEFGLIDLLKKDCIVEPKNVIVGIGDDAAVLKTEIGLYQLISTDMLIEGVHFDLAFISPFQLGYKSLAVNLSDIAAMGGKPTQVVISIALPAKTTSEFVLQLYEGMKAIASEFGVNIVGGDTVASLGGIAINVSVLGEVLPRYLQKRSSAKVGDFVAVTGYLGDSAAGLEVLQKHQEHKQEALVKAHLMPVPQVKAAQVLAMYANSMNDISDGIASESMEIAHASNVGMRIFAEKVPLSSSLLSAKTFLEKEPIEYALYGGEDYQLLFTIAPEKFIKLQNEKLDFKVSVIGEVTEEMDVLLVKGEGTIVKLEAKGYNHFI